LQQEDYQLKQNIYPNICTHVKVRYSRCVEQKYMGLETQVIVLKSMIMVVLPSPQ